MPELVPRPAAPHVLQPFVGRATVLQVLHSLEERLCILLGEDGVGKSRILREARSANANGELVIYTACTPAAAGLYHDPFVSVCRRLFARGCVSERSFSTVCEAVENDRARVAMDTLEQAARNVPIVLQIDDLHWASRATLRSLPYCTERLTEVRIRWQLAARAGSDLIGALAAALRRDRAARVMEIEGLPFTEFRELATVLASHLDDAEVERLYERTGGNPLYLEQLLEHYDGGDDIPGSLRQLLRERVHALPKDARSAAGWLAVHGAPFSRSGLAALSGFSPARIRLALAALVNAQVLRCNDLGCTFRSTLLQQAFYDELDDAERVEHHNVLEARTDNDWQRAAHLEAACRLSDAVALYNRIGWQKLDAGEPHVALSAFGSAREDAEPHSAQAWEAQGGIAAAMYAAGVHSDASGILQTFDRAADVIPPRVKALVWGRLAESVWERTREAHVAIALVNAALAQAADGAPDLMPRLFGTLAEMYENRGDAGRTRELTKRGLALCEPLQNTSWEIRLSALSTFVDAYAGELQSGIVALEAIAHRAILLESYDEAARCSRMLCVLCDLAADDERFEHWCRTGLAQGAKAAASVYPLLLHSAELSIRAGHLREALAILVSAVETAAVASYRYTALCAQAQIHAMLGEFDDGFAALQAARVIAPAACGNASDLSEGMLNELRCDDRAALGAYERAAYSESTGVRSELIRLRALAGVVRAACRLNRPDSARGAIDRLRAAHLRGWTRASVLLLEAEGHLAHASGETALGINRLLSAAGKTPEPFWKAQLLLSVACARRDRGLFFDVIETFDSMGCEQAADVARELARAQGMRPGRKREARGELSAREASIALLVASGKTNAEVGHLLHITSRTVEYHVGNILGKYGLRSRVELASRVAAGQLERS